MSERPPDQDFQLEEGARMMPGFREWCYQYHQDPEDVGSVLAYEKDYELFLEWSNQ